MPRLLALLSMVLVISSCTLEARHSRTCYETKPYDYANLPAVQKGDETPYVPTWGNCPAAVGEVLARDARCTEWYGEEKFQRDYPKPGSEAKRRLALDMMRGLRCDSVDDDIARLKQQYQHDPAIQRALDNASIDAVI